MRGQGNGGGQTQAKRLQWTMNECGQDFEQSQPNHGRPRVALVHGLGTRCGSLVRSNIRSKSGPSSLDFLDTTTRVVGASRSSGRLDYSRSPIASPEPSLPIARGQMPMDRPHRPHSLLSTVSGPPRSFNSPMPAFVHQVYVNRYTIGLS
jgi:hypothetical protein